MKNLRTRGKSTVVWILMGLLVLGLGGFGVTSFSGGSTEVGSVGETPVTADEYARGLRNQMNAYSRQTGQPLDMTEAQSLGLPRMVQAQLFTGAALEEQARIIGVSVGDERVRQSILSADAFKGPNGNFDRTAYSEILRRERLSETEFENTIRSDEARLLIQRAVSGGVVAPAAMVDQTAGWLLETRDLSWHELTEERLPEPVASPDEETLQAWHEANADRFTAPEKRKLSYVWLTPEMLSDEVELDEQALRDAYEANIADYVQPERRMVGRLVFPDAADADAAKASIDAGEQPFEAFVAQRGLTLDDVDLGEVSQDDLGGDTGEAVFALDQPGVVGPFETNLGPALFSMNAILDPVDIPFEAARDDLRAEAAADRASRMIDDRTGEFEDMLAGGATLEQVAEDTPMELGQIEWNAEDPAPQGSIAGYEAFRQQATEIAAEDFPQLVQLDDGGVFALRLDDIVPPTLDPFDEVREEVLADWRRSEIHRQLLAQAEEATVATTSVETPSPTVSPTPDSAAARVATPESVGDDSAADGEDAPADAQTASADAGAEAAENGAVDWTSQTGLTRNGWIDGLPGEILISAFDIETIGDIEIVDAGGRVFLIRLDGIHEADLTGEDAMRVTDAVGLRLGQTLQADIFDYYARAAQRLGGLQVNQSAINAINAQAQ